MYQCRKDESDECHQDCMRKVGANFGDLTLVEQLSGSQLNWNVLANSPSKSNQVCKGLNKPIGKPGTDVYVQSYTQNLRSTSKYTNLGRLCCASPCKCEYVFQFAKNNTEINNMIVPVVNQIALNLGYECSDEISDCISYCRKIAFITLDIYDPGYVKKDTTQRTDAFDNTLNAKYGQSICQMIGITLKDEYGFNVYLRYSVSMNTPNEFPYREDIHIGRLCCQWYPQFSWVPFNRCE